MVQMKNRTRNVVKSKAKTWKLLFFNVSLVNNPFLLFGWSR